MKKTIIYVLSIVILALSIFSISSRWEYLIGGYDEKEKELKENVDDYLKTQMGYSKEEVSEIAASYNRKQEDYFAEVIFADETGIKYIYTMDGEGGVIQVGYGYVGESEEPSEEAKHLEMKQ